ncbi:double-strand break repair protein AddB [Qingshengfaniella alkalisoli]|uniref:Double-strand break repair protein AddB n=1 Tax=Qingshengfaniella alkalisoli TaxID=2599296 RepID=A0A5B8J7K0_9RHOB|nr:double-strand break repair protein AddB [Qingshengfaniella alkalisoli]
MFSESTKPRLFGVPPGVDFPKALVDGLLDRFRDQPPEALARVTIYLNTRRMQRRVKALFDEGPARLLPRIGLVTDLASAGTGGALPPPVPSLRRKLQLAQLVARLIEAEPDLAPQSATFDLANGLVALMEEMQGEGVPLEAIEKLDVTDLSGHWERSRKFLSLVGTFISADPNAPLTAEGRQRRVTEKLIEQWASDPPQDPVIVAGSTASRGATRLFMQAVAHLPQGALVLPGFDFDTPNDIWSGLTQPKAQEDHPQFRFAALAQDLGVELEDIPRWHSAHPPNAERNALVSLALRPAPVTDGWRRDGPMLGDLSLATRDITLIEAADPRFEAAAIALRLRQAVEDGQTAALITPDRMLTRRVTAALDRWNIIPDDSAGRPLTQSPAGRLYLQAAGLLGLPLTAELLLALLKHPLVHAGKLRGRHLLWTHELELDLRRKGPPFPDAESLRDWAARWVATKKPTPENDPTEWVIWLGRTLTGLDDTRPRPLAELTAKLVQLVEDLAQGIEPLTEAKAVWHHEDVRQARTRLSELAQEAAHGADMTPREFRALLRTVLSGEVRNPDDPHPLITIWGTLEARVQGAELVILAGLNDGVWPELPDPDPWLNRKMRKQAGLLLPERRIGLSAHDFQQAIAAPQVVLTRAKRDAEAETVPSRWLNRLLNLLDGLPDQGGKSALADMRQRGATWLNLAAKLDRPETDHAPAKRPSPVPPVADRPTRLSVTDVETLIRDPFEIYARKILRLRSLDPLHKTPEARDRGNVLHDVLEQFVRDLPTIAESDRRAHLLSLAADILARQVPWPTARRLWLARLARVSGHFLSEEIARSERATPIGFEAKGELDLTTPDFKLVAKADRIDRAENGGLVIYDYKTGSPPSSSEQKKFAKQLLLEAVIAEHGGFEGIDAAPVIGAEYIGLGPSPKTVAAPLLESPVAVTLDELMLLLGAFLNPAKGYTAQLARHSMNQMGDYDHLSRAGEWDLSATPNPEEVGQ